MVMWGLAGFVVGFTTGLLVVLWPWGPNWFEAVGTWFGGVVAAAVGIVVLRTYLSEESARDREFRRQTEAAEKVKRAEEERLQGEADLVRCEARDGVSRPATRSDMRVVDKVEVEVENLSNSQVFDLSCRIHGLQLFEWVVARVEVLGAKERMEGQYPAPEPLHVHQGSPELHANAEFTFLQNRVRWSKRYGQSAKRL
jgi:hypothetical protein